MAVNADKPHLWSERITLNRPRSRSFDLHPDGARIGAAVTDLPQVLQDKLVFVFNFFDELRRVAPVKR